MRVQLLDDSTGWLGDMLYGGVSEGAVLAACDLPPDWRSVEERLVETSPAASYVTGQVVFPCGGRSIV